MARAVQCPHCKQTVQTSTPAGKQTRCKTCQERFRVPLADKKSKGAEFECPECGELTRSGAAPGQKTTCRSCGEKVRVPLRDAEPELPAEEEPTSDRPTVRRTCPGCGDKIPGRETYCPSCGIDIDEAIKERRYAGVQGDVSNPIDLLINLGAPGGALAMVVALVWFVYGLRDGVIWFFPIFLFVLGALTFVGGITGRRRR